MPSGVASGQQAAVVTTRAAFQVGGMQHVGALFSDNTTLVLLPGAVAGVPARRAMAGETITIYGVGIGAVTPGIAPAPVSYRGLAPNIVGLYQLNVVVPAIGASDAVPLTMSVGGVDVAQNLVIAVGN